MSHTDHGNRTFELPCTAHDIILYVKTNVGFSIARFVRISNSFDDISSFETILKLDTLCVDDTFLIKGLVANFDQTLDETILLCQKKD